jgi:CheY-like chemotaxis protein
LSQSDVTDESGTRPRCERPVLVVDDDGDLRKTLAEVVEDHGSHRVIAVRDGTEALDFLLRPDVALPCFIVLDLMMPVVNGWQVLSFLETHDAWLDIPVIVVSASMNRETLEVARRAMFLRKPIKLDPLLALVAACCERRLPLESSFG